MMHRTAFPVTEKGNGKIAEHALDKIAITVDVAQQHADFPPAQSIFTAAAANISWKANGSITEATLPKPRASPTKRDTRRKQPVSPI